MSVYLKQIEFFLPKKIISNELLESKFPDFSSQKIFLKTGIKERRITNKGEFASDLAIQAAESILKNYPKEKIDFLIYVTQSPDYQIPTTACILQDKLGLSTNTGSFDINQGCSGYIYGLALSKSLIESGVAKKDVLLITADTYSKLIDSKDKKNRTIFGDGATATIITREGTGTNLGKLTNSVFGSDGSGFDKLIIHKSGIKGTEINNSENTITDQFNNINHIDKLYMDGPEIFNFTLKRIPVLINDFLEENKLSIDEIDLFVFHQANKFMLNYIRKKMNIPEERFVFSLENSGNTVSSTIPIAMKSVESKIHGFTNAKILLCGFGVGYSWGCQLLEKV